MSLAGRIAQLRSDIDAAIDEKASQVAKENPGVTLTVIRKLLTGNSPECQCSQYLDLEKIHD